MQDVVIYPEGIIALCVVLLIGVCWFVLVKFVFKPSATEYSAFYTTEPKFQEPPGCEISLAEDRMSVNFGPNSDKESIDLLYAKIDAFGEESGVLFERSYFVAVEDKVHHFSLGRTKQLTHELDRRITEFKKIPKPAT